MSMFPIRMQLYFSENLLRENQRVHHSCDNIYFDEAVASDAQARDRG